MALSRRTLAVIAAGVVLFAGGTVLSLRPRRPDPAGPPSDPAEIRFPAVAEAMRGAFLEAQEAHRAALRRYAARDRSGGDSMAREALQLYDQAGALVADLSGLHYETLVSLSGDGRLDEGMGEARKWLQRFPADRIHRETLAKLCFRAGRYSECAQELESLLESRGGEAPHIRMLVDARAFEGSQAKAMEAVDRLLRAAGLTPLPAPTSSSREEEPENLRTAARACVRFQEYVRALPLLERLTFLAPKDPECRLLMGKVLRALGRCEEAAPVLAELHADPAFRLEAMEETAQCLAKTGRFAEAAKLLSQLLELNPTDASAYHQLAAALRRLRNDAGAEAMEKAAAVLRPGERERARVSEHRAAGKAADALLARAHALSFSGRYREADAAFEESPLRNAPDVQLRRARLYLEWIRVREAAGILEGLAGADSRVSPEVAEQAAALLAEARAVLAPRAAIAGNGSDPASDLRLSVARTPWPGAAPLLAELARLEEKRDKTQALAAARLACAADPGSAEAWRTLAGILDDPDQVFYRLEALKKLCELAPGGAETEEGVRACRKEIDRLLGQEG